MARYGVLRVATPDGQVREFPLELPAALVGRSPDNQIAIDDASVSLRHARLTVDSGRLLVEDLRSSSGTFVGPIQIEPNRPSLVEDGATLRFGDAKATFLPSGSPAAATTGQPSQGAVPGSVPPGQSQVPVLASLQGPTEPVAPGSPTTATLSVRNRGQVVDEVEISVPDLPATWVRITRESVRLFPGASEEIPVVIQLPRSPEAAAGARPFTVAVRSREHGAEVRVLGSLEILPFGELRASLQPARAKRDFRLLAENTGNEPLTLTLEGADDEAALRFAFTPQSIEIPPGKTISVGIRVTTGARRATGPEEVIPFRIEAVPASARFARAVLPGQLQSEPPLRTWKWPIAGVVLLALAAGGAFGYTKACPDGASACVKDFTGSGDSNRKDSGNQRDAAAATAEAGTATAVAKASASAVASGTPTAGATGTPTPATRSPTPAATATATRTPPATATPTAAKATPTATATSRTPITRPTLTRPTVLPPIR